MEPNVNYTIIGAFVISLVAVIVLTVIWLSSGFSFNQYSTYEVLMEEAVTGLAVDSSVEYNGVEVGTIKSIQLNHNNPRLVELLLNVKEDTPITQGTVATLNVRGITGITYVQLQDKGANLAPLQTLPGNLYPIIPTAPSLFMRLDTILTQLSTNISEITIAVKTLLNSRNLQAIQQTLRQVNEITATFANHRNNINVILDNTAHASDTLKMQMLPEAHQVLDNLNDISRDFVGISTQLKQNPSILIRGSVNQHLGPGEG